MPGCPKGDMAQDKTGKNEGGRRTLTQNRFIFLGTAASSSQEGRENREHPLLSIGSFFTMHSIKDEHRGSAPREQKVTQAFLCQRRVEALTSRNKGESGQGEGFIGIGS